MSAATEPPTPLELAPLMAVHILPEVLSVQDAVEGEIGWVILDRRLGKVHVLDPVEGLVRSWGRLGDGPGELRRPVALALQDTILWILNQGGISLERFSTRSGHLARRRIRGGGCTVGLAKQLIPLPEGILALLRTCPPLVPGPGTAYVERVDTTGWVTSVAKLPLGQPGSRRIHPLREALSSAWEGGLLLGTGDAPCLAKLTIEGVLAGHLCLPAYDPVPIPDEGRDDLRGRTGALIRLGFLPVDLPEAMPWFDRLFRVPQGIVVRRIRGLEARDLLFLSTEGTIFRVDALVGSDTFVGSRTLIRVRDLMQGTEIRVYPAPWGPSGG
jgi:hypothetical protein